MSLLELMITISISLLLVTIGSPAWLTNKQNLQLKHAIETSYFLIQHARASAIASAKDIYVSFIPGTNWCVGLNLAMPCDCTKVASCRLNGQDMLVSQQDFKAVTLANLRFGGNASAIFDGARGIAMGNAGSVIFRDKHTQAKLIVSNMGRVRICVIEGELGSYPQC